MALSYTTTPPQLGSILQAARKWLAFIIHQREADNTAYDRRKYVQSNGFSTSDNQEAAILAALTGHHDKVGIPSLSSGYSAYLRKALGLEGFGRILKEDLGLDPVDTQRAIYALYDPLNIDGTVAILRRRGLFGALYHDMLLAANAQYVATSAVGFGTFTAGQGNVGTLTDTSKAGKQYLRPGSIRFECVDESIARPRFSVVHTFTKYWPGRLAFGFSDRAQRGDNLLTAEKSWEDLAIGATFTLTRSGLASPTETDAANLIASSSVTNPQDLDSNQGVFYFKITRQTGDVWLIELYSDAARTVKVGVQSPSPSGTTSTAAVSITCVGGTVVATTFSKANAHTAMPNNGDSNSATQLDIKSPRLRDYWDIATTNDGAGSFNERLAEIMPAELPIAGSTEWTASLAAAVSMS